MLSFKSCDYNYIAPNLGQDYPHFRWEIYDFPQVLKKRNHIISIFKLISMVDVLLNTFCLQKKAETNLADPDQTASEEEV